MISEEQKQRNRESQKRYYERNRAIICAKQKKYYENHKDESKQYMKDWYEKNKESRHEKDAEHYKIHRAYKIKKARDRADIHAIQSKEHYRRNNKKIMARSKELRNPEKERARYAVHYAVRAGKIRKPDKCQDCGEKKRLTSHHEDYKKRLDVVWLCTKCHGKRHRDSDV